MAINVITNDATHKCVTFTGGNAVTGTFGKSVFGAGVVAVNFEKDSTSAANYTANKFDLKNKVWIVTNDNDATYRGCSIVEIDLNSSEGWAVSTAATTKLTDAATVAATILAYFAAYK
jgi:hypothetical protein